MQSASPVQQIQDPTASSPLLQQTNPAMQRVTSAFQSVERAQENATNAMADLSVKHKPHLTYDDIKKHNEERTQAMCDLIVDLSSARAMNYQQLLVAAKDLQAKSTLPPANFLGMNVEQFRNMNLEQFKTYMHVTNLLIRAIFISSCWSSRKMSKLMAFRTAQEDPDKKVSLVRSFINLTKKAVTEACLTLLTATAIVETVAYTALGLGATLLSPITKRPQEYVKNNIVAFRNSAAFTTLWTCTSLWKNIFQHKLPINEAQARNDLFKGIFRLVP